MFRATPVGIISKGVDTGISKVGIHRQEELGPEKEVVVPFPPCLDGSAAQTMHEDQLNQRFRRGVENAQAKWAS
jgi:hypothetical protein